MARFHHSTAQYPIDMKKKAGRIRSDGGEKSGPQRGTKLSVGRESLERKGGNRMSKYGTGGMSFSDFLCGSILVAFSIWLFKGC